MEARTLFVNGLVYVMSMKQCQDGMAIITSSNACVSILEFIALLHIYQLILWSIYCKIKLTCSLSNGYRYVVIWQVFMCFVLEDAWHYFIHRGAHHQKLYKHVHKLHHYHQSPFGMTAEYAHPIETLGENHVKERVNENMIFSMFN